jgi:hypothetical protein
MPRVNIPVTQITKEAVAPAGFTAGDAANDHVIEGNDGLLFLEAVNTAGAPAVITIETPGNVSGLAVADLEITVPAGATRLIGPFPPATFSQGTGSQVYVNVAANTWNLRAYHI